MFTDLFTSVNVTPVEINNCQLREDEGQELLGSQRVELDNLLKNHYSIFEVSGEDTPFIELSNNAENNPPCLHYLPTDEYSKEGAVEES
ncbi:hypothetical protein TNCT_152111 [Trichonephila clavata]|uniref:Uncharacterized protein n=1 Tax=Trichonephila clavata TaxID=2740835 RepID=A0A8X6IWT9_TRICU|nr:hypothetical protein TNCT_152111 [Trichonephila clavata]